MRIAAERGGDVVRGHARGLRHLRLSLRRSAILLLLLARVSGLLGLLLLRRLVAGRLRLLKALELRLLLLRISSRLRLQSAARVAGILLLQWLLLLLLLAESSGLRRLEG